MMAERLRITFDDQDLTTWRISILDDNHVGAYTEGQVLVDSVALSYEGAADETHAPIIGSSLSFSLIRTSSAIDDLLSDLVTTPEGEIRVHLYKDDVRIWLGVILPDTITIPTDYLNGSAEITAVDDLGLLPTIDYLDDAGQALDDWDRLTDHLIRILSRLRTSDDWASGDEFLRIYDHLTAGTSSSYQSTSLRTYSLRLHGSTFWTLSDGVYEFMTAEEALEQIALVMGARIFLDGGIWHFCPPWIADVSTTLDFYSFARDGSAYTAAGSIDAAITINSGASRLADGWATTYGPPMRSVYRAQAYMGNVYLMDQDYLETSMGTTINAPNEFDYQIGSQFTVAGVLKIDQDQIGTLTGPDRLVRYRLTVQVMIPGALVGGTRYYHAPVSTPTSAWAVETYPVNTSSATDNVGIFSPSSTSVGSWSTSSSGTGWEIWTPVLRANDYNVATDSLSFPFSFTTLPTIADGQGLGIKVTVQAVTGFVGATGGAGSGINTSLSGTYLGAADYYIQDLRVIYGDGSDNGNVIRYGATVSTGSKLRETLDLPTAQIGDLVSDNTNGRLQVRIGSDWLNTTRWTSHLHTTGTTVNRLLSQDRLALRQDPLTIVEGTIWRTAHASPLNVLVLASDRYIITSVVRSLFLASSQVTAYRIQDNVATIQDPDDDGTILPVAGIKGDPLIDQDGISIAGKSATLITQVQAAPITLQGVQEDLATNTTAISSLDGDLTTLQGTVSTNTTNISTNSGDISSLESSLAATQAKIEIIAGTFTAKGDDGATTTVVKYEEDKTDGMGIALTQNLLTMTSGTGTSALSISENSPGVFEIELSDGDTTPTAVPVMYATAGVGSRYYVGIGTTSPSAIGLTVVGAMRTDGVVEVFSGSSKLYALPITGGSAGQVLTRTGTDGTTWSTLPSTGISEVSDDTSPQLGGDLDLAGHYLDATSNTSATLLVTGNQYAFRFKSTSGTIQQTGLFFSSTDGQYQFLNGSGISILGVQAGSGVLHLGVQGGTGFSLPATDGSSGQVLQTNGSGSVTWATPASGGGDGWGIIAVSGQTSVEADQANDTLTLVAGTNVQITTDAGADEVTIGIVSSPTFGGLTLTGGLSGTTILATGGISTLGALFASGSLTAASASIAGAVTVGGTFTANGAIIGSGGLEFTGGGTSSIGIATGLPNQPDDLQIASNGNVSIILDADTDETGQVFEVKDGDGTVLFSVSDQGVSAGLLTTSAPTFTPASSYQQGSAQTITITNHTTGRTYTGAIYDSGGTEVTSSPLTFADDEVSFNAPSTVATGYEIRISAIIPGLLRSTETVETFEVTPSRTFTYWRIQGTDASSNISALKLGIVEAMYYTGPNQTGTETPTTNATSNTSISGVTISAGHSYSSSYAPWRAFDGGLTGAGSMFWTLGTTAANNWLQLEFSTAQTFESVRIITYRSFSDATHATIYGSNTGVFSGEEINCKVVALDGSATGTEQSYNLNL